MREANSQRPSVMVGVANLTWSVPSEEVYPQLIKAIEAGYLSEDERLDRDYSFMRLRISHNENDILPHGIGRGEGEIEDHKITWNVPTEPTEDEEEEIPVPSVPEEPLPEEEQGILDLGIPQTGFYEIALNIIIISSIVSITASSLVIARRQQ